MALAIKKLYARIIYTNMCRDKTPQICVYICTACTLWDEWCAYICEVCWREKIFKHLCSDFNCGVTVSYEKRNSACHPYVTFLSRICFFSDKHNKRASHCTAHTYVVHGSSLNVRTNTCYMVMMWATMALCF